LQGVNVRDFHGQSRRIEVDVWVGMDLAGAVRPGPVDLEGRPGAVRLLGNQLGLRRVRDARSCIAILTRRDSTRRC
jgi:hypothetical protein